MTSRWLTWLWTVVRGIAAGAQRAKAQAGHAVAVSVASSTLRAKTTTAASRTDFKLPARLAYTARCTNPATLRSRSRPANGRRQWRPVKAMEIVPPKKVARRHVCLAARAGRPAEPPKIRPVTVAKGPPAREAAPLPLAA